MRVNVAGWVRRAAALGHLPDRVLLAARLDGETPEHLARCPRCRARADRLAGVAGAVAAEAVREADAVFSAERLAEQRAHIQRRLERLAHPARVIAFPRAARVSRAGRRPQRWVAMAAAAGVIVGLVAGLALDVRPGRPRPPAEAVESTPPFAEASPDPVAPRLDPSTLSDELFLRELEAAALAPHVEALQALDALTPHVREVRASLVR
jgi:hypothetical protein